MPVHDWSKVDAGLFHHFHQRWIGNLCDGLNEVLPTNYLALSEQAMAGPVPDVLALSRADDSMTPGSSLTGNGGGRLATLLPQTRFIRRSESDVYALMADRVAIRHRLGNLVAVIEIFSPGNKSGKVAIRAFVDKAVQFLRQGVHLLIIDVFPPTPRDPQGLHKLIWDEIVEEPFALPEDQPLTLAAYSAGLVKMACVEPVAIGQSLPEMPLFLEPERYINTPLEPTYLTTWNACPRAFKEAVAAG